MAIKETGFDEMGNIARNRLHEDLNGETIGEIKHDPRSYLVFYNTKGEPLFMVRWEDIFDPSGNRFDIA